MDARVTVRSLALSSRRGAFVLRTPFRRHARSIADTRELALRVVAWLRREGIARGERAAIWGPSGPDWVAAFLGCALEGIVVVPLEDAAGPEFAARVQREAPSRVAFVGRATLESAHRVFDGVRVVVLEDLEELLRDVPSADASSLRESPDDALLEIVFTSGTTSDPKGVLLTHGNLLAVLRALHGPYLRWNGRLGWLVRRRAVLTLLPLSHMFGQVVGVFVPLMMDLVSVFVAPQGPPAIVQALKQEHCFVALTVPRFLTSLRKHLGDAFVDAETPEPSLWKRILAGRRVRRALGRRFSVFIVGGAALDPSEEMAWRANGYLIAQGYGLTETAPIVTLSNPLRAGRGVGKALHGQEIRIAPDGEVLVRGANVTAGYLQHGAVSGVVDDEGWFHTGDLGELDPDGRLRIVGRAKDVIVGPEGLNVHARDVELVLSRDARVREAAVVGLPRERGEEVHAVLVLASDADADDVVRVANAALPPYQRVKSWTRWQGADLPRTPSTGKVKKRELLAALRGDAPPPTAIDPLSAALGSLASLGSQDRSLAELGLSSLETVELVSRLEGEYQVVLDESKVRADMTLAELKALVADPSAGGPAVHVAMPRWGRSWWARSVGAFLRATLATPAVLFSARPFVVEGREHVESVNGPVLFVGNHSSYLDAPVFFRALPRSRRNRTGVAMATEPFAPLFTSGGTRWARAVQRLRYTLTVLGFGAFPLPRSGGFRGSLEYAGEMIDHGFSVLIFPEGKMTLDGRMQPFRSGAGLIARELDVPVVPFHVSGLWAVLPPGRGWWPTPGPVTLRFGPAIRLHSGTSAEEWVRAMEEGVRKCALGLSL